MTALLAVVALAAVCWLFRIAFVTLIPADRVPSLVQASLAHVAPAVLASIVAVELVGLTRSAASGEAAALLVGGVVIGVVAHRTRSLSVASALGLVLVVLLDLAPLHLGW